jgi:hypothetical protein
MHLKGCSHQGVALLRKRLVVHIVTFPSPH